MTRPSDNAAPWTWESDPFGATPPNDNPEGLNPFEYNLRFLGRSSKSVRSVWSEMQRLLANTGRLCCSDTGKRVAPTGATRLRALLDVRPLPRWPPQRWDPANGSRAVQSRKEHYGRRVVVYRLSRTRPRNGVRCMLSRLQLLVAGTRRATSGASRTALVVLVSLIAACDTGVGVSTRATLEETARSLVPEDATDSQSVSDAPWVQIDFDVRREPLVFAINADRLARAQDDGRTLCQPPTPTWTEFMDARVTPSRYRQERLYVLFKGGVLITLIGAYESDGPRNAVRKDPNQEARPIQHGTVKAQSAGETDAVAIVDALRLSCDPALGG